MLKKVLLSLSLALMSALPTIAATNLDCGADVLETITVTLEDGAGALLALDGATGNMGFGNVDGFASNYIAVAPAISAMMINSTTNALVNPATATGNNNAGGAVYIKGSATDAYAVRARVRIQGTGSADLSMAQDAGGSLALKYSKYDTDWDAGTDVTNSAHPTLASIGTPVLLAGTGGFAKTALSDNGTVDLDLAAKIAPSDDHVSQASTIIFTAVAHVEG